MAVLVCGGAGYIGSHNVRALLERGETPVVLDNFLTGHRASVPQGVRLYTGDMRDPAPHLACTHRGCPAAPLGWHAATPGISGPYGSRGEDRHRA